MKLIEEYISVRKYTENLCSYLTIEDYTPQSAAFASPPKWHIAHTTWFFEEMILKKYDTNYTVFNDEFSFLFNSYYNTIGKRIQRNERGLITRPNVDEIFKYRKYVDDALTSFLKNNSSKEVESLVILGLNHEQQHQELLLTDLKYTFSRNPIYPKYATNNFVNDTNLENGWLSFNEGIYEIGHKGNDFSFDNELGRHRVFLEPFKLSKSLVTNGEFIEFINSEGYKNPKYWLDDGWYWLQENKIEQPLYWEKIEEEWFYYTLAGFEKVNKDAILSHISFYEAAAFAFWKEMRLPTEFEWEIASEKLDWGKRWEWTNSAYLPYPKFKIKEGAVGEYNGKFMVNTMVLRGASSATSKDHSRKTYRNFFAPNTQWQFSGIRLAK